MIIYSKDTLLGTICYFSKAFNGDWLSVAPKIKISVSSLCPLKDGNTTIYISSLYLMQDPVSSMLQGLVLFNYCCVQSSFLIHFHITFANSRKDVYGPNDKIATSILIPPSFEFPWLFGDLNRVAESKERTASIKAFRSIKCLVHWVTNSSTGNYQKLLQGVTGELLDSCFAAEPFLRLSCLSQAETVTPGFGTGPGCPARPLMAVGRWPPCCSGGTSMSTWGSVPNAEGRSEEQESRPCPRPGLPQLECPSPPPQCEPLPHMGLQEPLLAESERAPMVSHKGFSFICVLLPLLCH